MNIFYFVFNIVPDKENPNFIRYGKGIAHLMVIEKDAAEARSKAIKQIISDQWQVLSEEAFAEIPVEQFPKKDVEPQDLLLYETAVKVGIAADYATFPREDAVVLQ